MCEPTSHTHRYDIPYNRSLRGRISKGEVTRERRSEKRKKSLWLARSVRARLQRKTKVGKFSKSICAVSEPWLGRFLHSERVVEASLSSTRISRDSLQRAAHPRLDTASEPTPAVPCVTRVATTRAGCLVKSYVTQQLLLVHCIRCEACS